MMVRLTLPPDLAEKLRELSKEEDRSMVYICRRALVHELRRFGHDIPNSAYGVAALSSRRFK